MGYSTFKADFKALSELLESDWDAIDFISVQAVRDAILTARNNGLLTYQEYRILYNIASYLIGEMRKTLRKEGILHDHI